MSHHHRILIVDDDPINLEILEEILGGHDLRSANDGNSALQIARDWSPDLILLDIMMPGIDGYEVCRRLRADSRLRKIKVVLVSAKAMMTERLAGYDAGADDYLAKPFDPDELLAKVAVFLRLKSAEEMDEMKSELLGLLAHEIRTPLTGIIPAGEMLTSTHPMDQEQRIMWGQMVLENGQRLHDIAEKGMLLCALRAGSHQLNRQTVDLRQFFRSMVADMQRRDIPQQFQFDEPTHECLAEIDHRLLRQVVQDVFGNAVRFGPDLDRIEVRVAMESDRVTFSITDHGPGIEQEVLASVFEAFTARNIDGQTVGSGLSMALASAIMSAHGGGLSVQSATGHGTTFHGWLPAAVRAIAKP